jgi:hypothetical protein
MEEYLFEKEIRIFGMKRSGNTTALYFLWGHFDLTNSIHIQNSNLSFHSSKSIKKGKPGLWIKRLAGLKENKVFTNGVEHLPIEYIGMALNPHYCYYADRKKYAIRCGKREFSKDVYNIVLIRSPHNHLASLVRKRNYKALFRGSDYYIEFGDLWVQYAKEALSITNHIPNKIPVLFDKLVDSVDYRKSISDALGFVYNDSGINVMTRKVSWSPLDRWKYLIDPGKKVWWTLDGCKEKLLRPDVVEYTKALFNIDLEELFNE